MFQCSNSEGSVIAYYTSEFNVPVGQEGAVDHAMDSLDTIVNKQQQRRHPGRDSSNLVFDNVVTEGEFLGTG